MKTITLKNEFHGTQVRLRVPKSGRLTPRQMRRAKEKLCGVSTCTCGDAAGCRPARYWDLRDCEGAVTGAEPIDAYLED